MPTLAEIPRVEFVAPADCPPLATFSCGSSSPWEDEVDEIFRGLSSHPEPLVRVAYDSSTGDLIGAGFYEARSPVGHMPGRDDDAAYIVALSLTEQYRGWDTPEGTPIGDFLLEDLLVRIRAEWEDEMPAVWAIVAKKNALCIRLMDTHGFSNVPAEGLYDMWYRQRGLPPDWWRED